MYTFQPNLRSITRIFSADYAENKRIRKRYNEHFMKINVLAHSGDAPSPGCTASSPRPHLGVTRPHLGATRPRVGICLSRLDALTSKYISITNRSIANLGYRPQVGNADAGTRRPQVRTR